MACAALECGTRMFSHTAQLRNDHAAAFAYAMVAIRVIDCAGSLVAACNTNYEHAIAPIHGGHK